MVTSLYEEISLEASEEMQADASDVDRVAANIRDGAGDWCELSSPLDLQGVPWTPHLFSTELNAVMHIHLADSLRPYLIKRLRAAREAGRHIHVALEMAALYDYDTVVALGELDAVVHLISGSTAGEGKQILALLADESIPVESHLRRTLAQKAWDMRTEGSSYERGHRFEALLAFLFSATSGFRVRDRNFRGKTDEIDIVLQLDRVSTRSWYDSTAPFLLVEAKNWAEHVNQKEVSAFITKLQTKRGRTRIGFLVARSGFTSDAELQELKLAMTNLVVVMIGPRELLEWINSSDPDQYLDDFVGHAMLR